MVLVFWAGNFGGGGAPRARWPLLIGPILSLAPLLLPLVWSSISLPLQLLAALFGLGFGGTAVYDSPSQTWQRRQGATRSGAGSGGAAAAGGAAQPADEAPELPLEIITYGLISLTSMLVTAALTVLLLKLMLAARRYGVRGTLQRIAQQGLFGGWDRAAGGGGGGGGQRPQGRTRAERIERVASLMQTLPVEVFRSREELERMTVSELKHLLKKRGVECQDCLEKGDLVAALTEGANSTAASCSVCCEDYMPDDVMRVLRCGHRYHLECIDRWLLSSTDYSRPPACPVCAQELEAPPATAGDGSGGGG